MIVKQARKLSSWQAGKLKFILLGIALALSGWFFYLCAYATYQIFLGGK